MSVDPFIPWDATDEEIADLYVIREQVPDALTGALTVWLSREIEAETDYQGVSIDFVHEIETSLRRPLRLSMPINGAVLISRIVEQGQRYFLQVIDFLLTRYEVAGEWGPVPENIARLSSQMAATASALEIAERGGDYRLRRRIPEGVESAAQRAIADANVTAGSHLASAWREVQEMDPDTRKILREGIQAFEAAAGPVVTPRDKQFRLSKIVGALRDQPGWGLVLARRDDNHPDHLAVLLGMIETLAFAEQFRHSGPGYSVAEATGHVQLAATLVGWFSSGVVTREETN